MSESAWRASACFFSKSSLPSRPRRLALSTQPSAIAPSLVVAKIAGMSLPRSTATGAGGVDPSSTEVCSAKPKPWAAPLPTSPASTVSICASFSPRVPSTF